MAVTSITNGLNGHTNGTNGTTNRLHRGPDGTIDLKILGMNSGTAMDGIDCALVHYRQASPTEPLHMRILKVSLRKVDSYTRSGAHSMQYDEIPVPQHMKKPILRMLRETSTTPSLMSQLNVQLGLMFGEAVKEFCDKHAIEMDSIDLIGSHGQTIWLLSMPQEGETRSAFCLGEGTVISGMTGITTVTDFRMAEQAVGRQGVSHLWFRAGLYPLTSFVGSTGSIDRWLATSSPHRTPHMPEHRRHCKPLHHPARLRRWSRCHDRLGLWPW